MVYGTVVIHLCVWENHEQLEWMDQFGQNFQNLVDWLQLT